METEKLIKYQRAQKKVAQIRGFYNHLVIYSIVNLVLYFLRDKMTVVLLSKQVFGSPEILENMHWDVFGTPIVWGIILVFHAIKVFGNTSIFGKDWEERKIREFLNDDENNNKWK